MPELQVTELSLPVMMMLFIYIDRRVFLFSFFPINKNRCQSDNINASNESAAYFMTSKNSSCGATKTYQCQNKCKNLTANAQVNICR